MNQDQTPPLFINIGTVNFHAYEFHAYEPEPMTLADVILARAPAPRTQAKPGAAKEYRVLGDGQLITQKQAMHELAELGAGWRLETPHELFALVDYSNRNLHGALCIDDTIKAQWYWTSQKKPGCPGARVVVGFAGDGVHHAGESLLAHARAVRVTPAVPIRAAR